MDKIAILDYSMGEVYIADVPKDEDTHSFFRRKGIRESDVHWMRGDIRIYIDNNNGNQI